MMQSITKPTHNEEFRTCQFRRPDGQGQLNESETVTAASVVCTERSTGQDVTSEMISSVAPYASTQVRYKLTGGTAGRTYLLRVRCETSNSQKLEETFELRIGP